MASPTVTELAARIAILEAKLSPDPQALTPPITIGSLNNVPAPGSQLAAQWAQDMTGIGVHVFGSKSGVDGWATAPAGRFAIAVDTGILWRRVGGVWSQFSPWTATTIGSGLPATLPSGFTTVNTATIPADPGPRTAYVSCFVRADMFHSFDHTVTLVVDGLIQAEATFNNDSLPGPALNTPRNVSLSGQFVLPTARAVPVAVQVYSSAAGTAVFNSLHRNRIDITVVPR